VLSATCYAKSADAPSATSEVIRRTTSFIVATSEFSRAFRGFGGVHLRGVAGGDRVRSDMRDTAAVASPAAHVQYGRLLKDRGWLAVSRRRAGRGDIVATPLQR
jgi:hypothetical protein